MMWSVYTGHIMKDLAGPPKKRDMTAHVKMQSLHPRTCPTARPGRDGTLSVSVPVEELCTDLFALVII